MPDLSDLVSECIIKPQNTIKRICAPLRDSLGIDIFGYACIDPDGGFLNISNFPDSLEFFYKEKLYFTNPYVRCPHFFHSGYTLTQATLDPNFQEITFRISGLNYMFMMLQKNGESNELFFFANKKQSLNDSLFFLNQIHLFQKFATYFKREARPLINSVKEYGYNVKKALGQAFYDIDASVPLLTQSLKSQNLLKKIFPLSLRERQCLDLFKQGNSTQATGAILNLSPRTVEHYFENIKDKLGCKSKWELLEW